MAKLEEIELDAYRDQIGDDLKRLVEKYRAIFDWDVPDIEQGVADRLILGQLRKCMDAVEREVGSTPKQ